MKNKLLKIFYLIIVFIILFGCSQVHAGAVSISEKPSYWTQKVYEDLTSKNNNEIRVTDYLYKDAGVYYGGRARTENDPPPESALMNTSEDKSKWKDMKDNKNIYITTSGECILYINQYMQKKGYEEAKYFGDFEEDYIAISEAYIKSNIIEFMKRDVANESVSETEGTYYMDIMKNATEFIEETRKTSQLLKIGAAYYKSKGEDVKATNTQFTATDGKTVSFADSDDVKKNYTTAQVKKYIEEYGEEGIKLLNSDVSSKWNWEQLKGTSIKRLLNENKEKYVKNLTGLTVKELEEKQKLVGKNVGQRLYKIPTKDADKDKDTNLDEIVTAADAFINSATENKIEPKMIQNLSNTIYNILLVVGIVIAVIIGAVIGIMFITGSVEQKADVKKLLIPYIVGCVVVFGSFAIWKIAVIMFSSM